MNFFKLYIGDYQRDTAHLSVTEHGAFLLMLQHYYATEKPLPTGKALHRMLRAQDKQEKDAIDTVAAEFWTATELGLINIRADREITRACEQASTNARIAQQREASRKAARERNEQSTNRATNDQPNQTPDTRQEQRATTPDGVVVASKPATPDCPHSEIVAAYHELLPTLRRVREWTPDRQAFLRARWREKPERQSLAWWRGFFEYVAGCPLLMGEVPGRDGGAPFSADLEWLVRPTNFRKVIEGKYQRRAA